MSYSMPLIDRPLLRVWAGKDNEMWITRALRVVGVFRRDSRVSCFQWRRLI